MATRRQAQQPGDLLLPLPGMIVCDLCPAARSSETTDSDARALGWRVWRGPSLTGAWIDAVLCPDCAAGDRR